MDVVSPVQRLRERGVEDLLVCQEHVPAVSGVSGSAVSCVFKFFYDLSGKIGFNSSSEFGEYVHLSLICLLRLLIIFRVPDCAGQGLCVPILLPRSAL